MVVVGAEVMGVPGDYILDTASPHTQLADSQAQTAGFAETALTGEVRLAGVVARNRPVAVEVLDLRTGALPTPIAGVIGADVLRGYVVDVSFAPCRVALRPAGQHQVRGHGEPAMGCGRPARPSSDGFTPSPAPSPGHGRDTGLRLSDEWPGGHAPSPRSSIPRRPSAPAVLPSPAPHGNLPAA